MTIQLAGILLSPSVQTVLVICKELDVPYTLLPVNFSKGDTRLPENLQYHPFGQIPYLLDSEDGEVFSLYESRAIARYIAEKT